MIKFSMTRDGDQLVAKQNGQFIRAFYQYKMNLKPNAAVMEHA
jgi:hypothetical protein